MDIALKRAQRLMAQVSVSDQTHVVASETAAAAAKSKAQKIKEFEDVYRQLAADIVAELPKYEMPQYAIDYIKKVRCNNFCLTMQLMDYTVPGGKMNRGLSVIDTLEEIYGRSLTDDERFKASILGWTIEWV